MLPSKNPKKSEYREAKERLEKTQRKYISKHKEEKGNGARTAPRLARLEHQKRWLDWRISDGKEYPVKISKIKKNNEK